MDAVYILGSGSIADNIEILYSVRSLEKHMLDLGDIYVIGDKPDNLPLINHVPADDPYDKPKKNAYHKIKIAAELSNLSDDFLLMNDDFFMLEPFTGADFPFYCSKSGGSVDPRMKDFTIHCPFRYNKDLFLKLPDLTRESSDLSIRSLYSWFYRCPPTPTEDVILRYIPDGPSYTEQLKDTGFFSCVNSVAAQKDFQDFLHALYPTPSQYEKPPEY